MMNGDDTKEWHQHDRGTLLSILEKNPLLIGLLQEGQIIYANGAFCRFFRMEPREDWDSPSPELSLLLSHAATLERTLPGPIACNETLLELPSDGGSSRWLRIQASAINIGGREALLLNATDETLRVEERNRLISDVGQKAAGLGSDTESFIYSVSHELKSHILSIEGLIGILLNSQELMSPGLTLSMERVRQNAEKMAALLDDLLELSRIARFHTEKQKINLPILTRQTLSCMEARNSYGRIRISYAIPGVEVSYSPHRLSQLIKYFIDNAIKALQSVPNAEISLGAEISGGEVIFHIRDNGTGIDPAYHGEIFLPFRRLPAFKNFPGNGMGLTIARKITEVNGGRIFLESEPEKGTAFHFTIPFTPGLPGPA